MNIPYEVADAVLAAATYPKHLYLYAWCNGCGEWTSAHVVFRPENHKALIALLIEGLTMGFEHRVTPRCTNPEIRIITTGWGSQPKVEREVCHACSGVKTTPYVVDGTSLGSIPCPVCKGQGRYGVVDDEAVVIVDAEEADAR